MAQRRLANLDERRAAQRRRYHANPEKHRNYGRAQYQADREWRSLNYTISKYGLTLDQFHALQERQDFCCAICGDELTTSGRMGLHIDHSHDTGKVRGLLCGGCNLGIGHFRERGDALTFAAQYLAARA